MYGYFIRVGDKTSCGGTVTGGKPYDTISTLMSCGGVLKN